MIGINTFEEYAYLRPLHKKLLEILDSFSHICKELGVRFFLAYGTLLGAARHSNIIPWDDDLDIQMTRADYEKLKGFFGSRVYKSFSLVTNDNSNAYDQNFAKLVYSDSPSSFDNSTSIDIFPLDYSPSFFNPIFFFCCLRLFYLKRIVSSKRTLMNKKENAFKRFARKVFVLPYRKCSTNQISKKMDRLFIHFKSKKYISNFGGVNFKELCHVKSCYFASSKSLPLANRMYEVPKYYERMLQIIYGKDWNAIPSKSKRIQHADHNYAQ